jgi:hypothetical protein
VILDRALRRPWPVLVVWALVWALSHAAAHGWSWHFLVSGVDAFFSPNVLSLYADHPELQMGPLTFLVSGPFVLLTPGAVGQALVMLGLTAVGLLVVREVRLVTVDLGTGSQRSWFLVSLLILVVWSEIAVHWVHVDDAGALLFGVVALRLARQGRFLPAAIAIGLAIDFKPWAIPFAAIVFLAPFRRWVPLGLVAVGVVLVAWLPFVLGNSETLTAMKFAIPVDPASTLHLLDPNATGTPPWDRYAQILGALVLGVLAVARRRWWALVAVVIAVRLLLDPGAKNYYDVGIVLGAGIVDIALAFSVVPLATLSVFVFVYLPSYLLQDDPGPRSVLRTACLVLVLVLALAVPVRRRRAAHASEIAEPSRASGAETISP